MVTDHSSLTTDHSIGPLSYTTSIIVDPSTPAPAVDLPALPRPAPPRPSLSRQLRRNALAAARLGGVHTYEGAAQTPMNRDWITAHYSGDAAIMAAWDNLVPRARDLARNEPWAAQALRRIVENTVGAEGIVSESAIEVGEELDEESNTEIDTWFRRWAENECDFFGEMDFAEMQSVALSDTAEAGEVFLIRVDDPRPRRIVPICFQVLETEQLDHTHDGVRLADGGYLKRGIEYDRLGRKIAFHFWAHHPYENIFISADRMRIPAERVIHYYRKLRPSQTRGVTWFATILQALRDMSQYVGDEMTAARIASWFTVAIKRAQGAGTGLGMLDDGDEADAAGNPLEKLGPGTIADIGAGDDVSTIDPGRPNAAAGPWIKLILQSLANGIGLTYLGLTGDTAEASFSSARSAQNKDKVFYRTEQGRFGRRVVLPIRQAVVRQLVAVGRVRSVSPQQMRNDPYRWLATHLTPPGWEEIQIVDETNAAISRIQAGLSTLQEECAGHQRNYRRVLKQRALEMGLVKGLGLDLTTNYPGRINVTQNENIEPANQNQNQAAGGNANVL